MGRRGPRIYHDFLYVMPAMPVAIWHFGNFFGFSWFVAAPHLSLGASTGRV